MSETPPENPGTDFTNIPVTEAPEIVIPQIPDENRDDSAADSPPVESPAERVRRRLRSVGTKAGGDASAESASRPPKSPRATPPKPREGSLVKPLTDVYTSLGLMVAAVDPICSVAIIDNAEDCAKSVEKLARENESVRRVVTRLLETSAWGGVLVAHLPILLAVMMHHGPEPVRERVAPLTMMMNPKVMQRMAEQNGAPQPGAETA